MHRSLSNDQCITFSDTNVVSPTNWLSRESNSTFNFVVLGKDIKRHVFLCLCFGFSVMVLFFLYLLFYIPDSYFALNLFSFSNCYCFSWSGLKANRSWMQSFLKGQSALKQTKHNYQMFSRCIWINASKKLNKVWFCSNEKCTLFFNVSIY